MQECCCWQRCADLQRFRRRTRDVNEDDSDWAASDGEAASDEEADGTYKPQYAFWAEKGTWKAKGTKGPTRGRGAAVTPALNRHKARHQVSNATGCHNCAVLGQAQRQWWQSPNPHM